MILILQRGTTEAQTQEVLQELERLGLRGRTLDVLDKPLIHIVEGPARQARRLRMERVEALVPTGGPRVRRYGRRFYPYHFINWGTAALVLLGVLVVLSAFLPPQVDGDVQPFGAPLDIAPPWYLRGLQALLALLPARLAWLSVFVLTAAVLLVPQIDRQRARGMAFVLASLAVAAWFILMVWGAL